MVGTPGKQSMKRHEFTTKIKQFIDTPQYLGDTSKGWDCLNILREIYTLLGKDFPKEFKGWNAENYAERWRHGEGKDIYREFLLSLGESINPAYAIHGDLFIFEGNAQVFPAIYLGKGHLLMVFAPCDKKQKNRGCKVVPLSFFKRFLIDVRRIS